MIIYPNWIVHMNKLCLGNDDRRRSAIEARQINANVNDDNFWISCDNYHHMSKEVLKALRVFDSAEPAIDRAWLMMKNLGNMCLVLEITLPT